MVIGLAIGSVVSALIAKRAMRKPDLVTASGRPVTDADRRLAMQVIAAISAVLAAICLIVGVIVGETVFLILAAIFFIATVVWVRRTGAPRAWWREWSATWRR